MEREQKYAFVGVDPVILNEKKIVLAQRGAGADVEVGSWHIPGALVQAGETLEEALQRAAKAKTNLDIDLLYGTLMESFVQIYATPTREPRYHDVALSFLCKVVGGEMVPGERMTDVKEFAPEEIETLDIGFDHKQILLDAVSRLTELGYFE